MINAVSTATAAQGYGDVIFALLAGLLILGIACGVIVYVAKHRNTGY